MAFSKDGQVRFFTSTIERGKNRPSARDAVYGMSQNRVGEILFSGQLARCYFDV